MKALLYFRIALMVAQIVCLLAFIVMNTRFGVLRFVLIFAALHAAGQYVQQLYVESKEKHQEQG